MMNPRMTGYLALCWIVVVLIVSSLLKAGDVAGFLAAAMIMAAAAAGTWGVLLIEKKKLSPEMVRLIVSPVCGVCFSLMAVKNFRSGAHVHEWLIPAAVGLFLLLRWIFLLARRFRAHAAL